MLGGRAEFTTERQREAGRAEGRERGEESGEKSSFRLFAFNLYPKSERL